MVTELKGQKRRWMSSGASSAPHLPRRVPRVPQRVPQVLAGARGGVDHLEGHARVAVGAGGLVLPVGLGHLLPHHHVEAAAGLVAEDEAGIVVIPVGVHIEGATEVHGPELVEACEGHGRGGEDGGGQSSRPSAWSALHCAESLGHWAVPTLTRVCP